MVHGAMMRRAEHDEIIGVVMATFRAQLEVVHVDERRVPAPGYDAAAVIAAEDVTAERRRDGLRGAVADSRLWMPHVGFVTPPVSGGGRVLSTRGMCCASHRAISTMAESTSSRSPQASRKPRPQHSQTVSDSWQLARPAAARA
jgi:hypothetical protein